MITKAVKYQPSEMSRSLSGICLVILCVLGLICSSAACGTNAQHEKIDSIRIEKSRRLMHLFHNGRHVKTYRISLGRNPVGDKVQEGDNRTPEGTYFINGKISEGRYYRYLCISYPDKSDCERALTQGVNPGCDIMIHGLPWGYGWLGHLHLLRDWTYGCIAVTNGEMDELYTIIETGTPVEIVP